MATVDKDIADRIVAGEFNEDGWVKIVKYTNMEGGDAYGCVHPEDDPFRYRETAFVRNPVDYWRKPGYIEPGVEVTVFVPPYGQQEPMTILCDPNDAQWFRDHNVKLSAETLSDQTVVYADLGIKTDEDEPDEVMILSGSRDSTATMKALRQECEKILAKQPPKETK